MAADHTRGLRGHIRQMAGYKQEVEVRVEGWGGCFHVARRRPRQQQQHVRENCQKGRDELFCVMRRRRRRAAGTSITYAGVLQMHTACENHIQAACAVSPKASWVKATNCCTRVDGETSGAASGLWRRNPSEQTRNIPGTSGRPHLADHADLLTLQLPSAPNTLPGASFPPRSRPYEKKKDAQTLKAFTFGLIASVCSDCWF